MNLLHLLARAFSSNLGTLKLGAGEQERLASKGFTDLTVQRYVLWRRATLLMVVVATILSAVVSTVSSYTEPEDQPDFRETLTEGLLKKIEQTSPVLAKLIKAHEEAAEPTADQDEPNEKDKNQEEKVEDERKALGRIADAMHLASLYSLPVAALLVLFLGNRFRLAYRLMVIAFAFSFFAPMLLALCPWSWWGVQELQVPASKDPVGFLKDQAEGLLEGAAILGQLLPSVLSLIPGIQRACLRVKTLLPEALLPGWFIVIASPLYGLFLLVVVIAVDQVTKAPALLLGLALLAASSLIYAIRPGVFTRPLLAEADYRRMRGMQRIVSLLSLVAGALLLSMVSGEFLGVHLVGTDPSKALMRPIEVAEFLLEVIGRSMFVSALGVEFIMRMNLTAWRQNRMLAGSPASIGHDGAMQEFGAVA